MNIALEASAGCGKTTRLISELCAAVLEGGTDLDRLAVITFTRKAAAELRTRLALALSEAYADEQRPEAARRRAAEQLTRLGGARVSTIHSFCESLLRAFPLEAGIDPAFTVLEEDEAAALFDECYLAWLQTAWAEQKDEVRLVLLEHRLKPLSEGEFDSSPFQEVLRTALQYRELELFEPALPDLWSELQALHGEAKAFLAQCPQGTLLDFLAECVATLERALGKPQQEAIPLLRGLDFKPGNRGPRSEEVKQLRDRWKEAWASRMELVTYCTDVFPTIAPLYAALKRLAVHFVASYRATMRERGVLDFEELLVGCERLLHNQEVRATLKQRFDRLFVDEFHDTDPIQAKIMFFLAEAEGDHASSWEKVRLAPGKLFVVGDPKQSIYRFRRADIASYSKAMELIKASARGQAPEPLKTNYRCAKDLISWINQHFQKQFESAVFSAKDGHVYSPRYLPLEAPPKATRGAGKVIRVEATNAYYDRNAADLCDLEARLTALTLQRLLEHYQPGDIMVLYRNKKNLAATSRYLDELQMPHELSAGKVFFDRQEIHDALNLLSAVADPLDQLHVLAALKGPFFGLDDRSLAAHCLAKGTFDYRFAAEQPAGAVAVALGRLKTLHERSGTVRPHRLLQDLLCEGGLLGSYGLGPGGRQQLLNLQKLAELLASKGALPFHSVVRELRQDLEADREVVQYNPKHGEASLVQLMTIHKAKGLESRVVYLADCTSNELPKTLRTAIDTGNRKVVYTLGGKDSKNLQAAEWKEASLDAKKHEQAEAVRLRYVAATRAKELFLFNRLEYGGQEKKLIKNMAEAFAAPFFDEEGHERWCFDLEALDLDPLRHAALPAPKLHPEWIGEETALAEAQTRRRDLAIPSLVVANPSTAALDAQPTSLRVEYEEAAEVAELLPSDRRMLGTLVHRLLELEPTDPETLAAELCRSEAPELAPRLVVDAYRQIRGNAIFEQVRHAKRLFREMPLLFTDSDGTAYHGVIDLLFETPQGWVIVDYKTTLIADEEKRKAVEQHYAAQMALYQRGLEQLGLKVKECVVVGR